MSPGRIRSTLGAVAVPLLVAALAAAPATAAPQAGAPTVDGPIPGTAPGDRNSGDLAETYPFFSTHFDLAAHGYVEEEFYLSGVADGFSPTGERVADDVPYRTRIVVRRPVTAAAFTGTVLMEWQNVTAGYDLDALWNPEHVTRNGYAWVGVSAQRVGVDFLRAWSPVRYGTLDVTGGGAFLADELSYDIFAQAAHAVRSPAGTDPMGGLAVERVLAIGASQSAGRMRIYYDEILPQVSDPVFDGYAFIVGQAPARAGTEPVFQVLSETDVRTPLGRRPDSDVFRRWEVAGSAHSGYHGTVYRGPLQERDLPEGAPEYTCDDPPFSRVPLHYVTTKAYDHLAAWVEGTPPPHAPYLEFDGDQLVRNELGLAQGGIQLSQVAVPTALNTGQNSGELFCFLFGTHQPFDDELLQKLYPNHGAFVSAVARVSAANVRAGFIDRADATADVGEAARSGVGR
ncbi:MAG TPA: alpha/beta hydrolase domain-containing protein [Natronosporangium sp.]|nr:alpha/beta hydrolase domain-containing protein [Natronosporangium sp.]